MAPGTPGCAGCHMMIFSYSLSGAMVFEGLSITFFFPHPLRTIALDSTRRGVRACVRANGVVALKLDQTLFIVFFGLFLVPEVTWTCVENIGSNRKTFCKFPSWEVTHLPLLHALGASLCLRFAGFWTLIPMATRITH